jgi:hypothetical protein
LNQVKGAQQGTGTGDVINQPVDGNLLNPLPGVGKDAAAQQEAKVTDRQGSKGRKFTISRIISGPVVRNRISTCLISYLYTPKNVLKSPAGPDTFVTDSSAGGRKQEPMRRTSEGWYVSVHNEDSGQSMTGNSAAPEAGYRSHSRLSGNH